MGDIEAMLREIVRIADDDTIGYSQPDRLGRHNVDCSELMRLGLLSGGWPINYLWTGNMHQELPRVGWSWHPGTDGIRRGDILWKQGHTAAYLGGGQRAEAWIAEDGSIAGRPGDQTGQEVRVHSPWNDIAWSGYFRAPAGSTYTSQSQEDDMTPEQARKLDALYWSLNNSILPALSQVAQQVNRITTEIPAMNAAMEVMAKSQGLDPAAVTQAVTDAVDKSLADVSITLTTKEA